MRFGWFLAGFAFYLFARWVAAWVVVEIEIASRPLWPGTESI